MIYSFKMSPILFQQNIISEEELKIIIILCDLVLVQIKKNNKNYKYKQVFCEWINIVGISFSE